MLLQGSSVNSLGQLGGNIQRPITINFVITIELFYLDEKEKIFSSTMSRLNRDSSSSNFSQTDSAQFRSTKV